MSYSQEEIDRAKYLLIREFEIAEPGAITEDKLNLAVDTFTNICKMVLYNSGVIKLSDKYKARIGYWQYIHALLDIARGGAPLDISASA